MAGTTLGTAYVQIVPSAKGIKGSITNVLDPEAQAAGTSVGGKIGAFAKKALVAAGIGALAVKGIKIAMDEGAKLQQSYLGGVDTLYGEAAEKVRAYAREAAQAGISMNNYSEQAVSFGAALKNAYGGDVVKAAQAANTAIMDMADNSAKMGTDIQSVQDAYQGFAKQNYTMLDNLKLGYGGTKTEMERLLADAEKLTGIEYNIDNLGDVYEAIHVIQGDLGLTGVAAQEAATTFSGSFGAMKAAAQNLLGSIALGQGVGPAMQQLASSVSTFFFGNFMPMLGRIIKSIPTAIIAFAKAGIPALLSGFSSMMTTMAASIKKSADGLTSQKVSTWAKTTIPKLISTAGTLIKRFALSLVKNLPSIVASLAKIGAAIIKGLGSALYGKVSAAANKIKDKFMAPINRIKDKVKGVLNKIKGLFPLKIGKIFSGMKLPHFKVSGGKPPFGIGGQGSKPSISVSWYKKGGIVNDTTIIGNIGLGEDGPEAIVPLTPFWKRLDEVAGNAGDTNIVININGADKNPRQIAEEVKRILIKETNNRRLAWQ